MSEKDMNGLIKMINTQLKDEPDKEVSGEFVCENGVTYHYETI